MDSSALTARPHSAPKGGSHQVLSPAEQRLPLVVASPHSGSDYPAAFVAASRLDPLALRRSEDSFVDEIFAEHSITPIE